VGEDDHHAVQLGRHDERIKSVEGRLAAIEGRVWLLVMSVLGAVGYQVWDTIMGAVGR
jgi:hypothetical protein